VHFLSKFCDVFRVKHFLATSKLENGEIFYRIRQKSARYSQSPRSPFHAYRLNVPRFHVFALSSAWPASCGSSVIKTPPRYQELSRHHRPILAA
jgi:hypothetical protein